MQEVYSMRVLLVEDEPDLGAAIKRTLEREKYIVDWVTDGNEAWGYLEHQWAQYTLAIFDWLVPGLSGLELLQRLRDRNNPLPVLMLTARDTMEDKVTGLDAGADDYLVKPFELRELLARVRARVRRSPSQEVFLVTNPSETDDETHPRRLRVEDLELDCDNQIAYRGKRAIALSEKESQLLEYLMTNPNQLLTHEAIYQHLWATTTKPSSNVLAAQIRLLRRKIEPNDEAPLIHTVYGKGYRFGLGDA